MARRLVLPRRLSIKALDQENVSVHCFNEHARCNAQLCGTCKAHGNELGFDNAVGVGERGKLRDKLQEIRDHLAEGGLLKKGGIVDATIISVPSSTGNGSNARDPGMHQTKKGNRWHFGMKLHIGTDPRGLAHHLEVMAANVHDLTPSGQLLHGEEEQVRGDTGYAGLASVRSTRIAMCRGRLP